MTTETKKNFLGIPVEGDIRSDYRAIKQLPISEIQHVLLDLLNDPYFVGVGWTQYTPYFNDGEPCEFEIHEPYFLTVDDKKVSDCAEGICEHEDEDDCADIDYAEDLTVSWGKHPSLGEMKVEYEWEDGKRSIISEKYEGNKPEEMKKAHAFAKELNSGAFDDAFREQFQDHARVFITRNKVVVDAYSHD